MNAPLTVSVITPSYNQGRFIERTIRSVLEQDYPLQYVVMDGGSRDETLDVLRRFDGQLRWASESDRGQAHAVNKGIAATHGEIIGWLNSDDVYYAGAVRRAVEQFQAHPEADIVYGDAHHIDEGGCIIDAYPTEEYDFERLKDTCFLCQPATFFRRRLVSRIGLLAERLWLCMDYEYWLRAGLSGARFLHVPEPLAGSRLYRENKTLANRLAVHEEINHMLLRLLGSVPDQWLLNHARTYWQERGLDRNSRLCFAMAVSCSVLHAALHWNRSIRLSLLGIVADWIGRHLWGSAHRIFAR